jgi:hypothetical protein
MRDSADSERGYGVMQFILATLALLVGVLAWMVASAGLTRYHSQPGSDWTELLPAIVIGFVAALLAAFAVFAARVNRQRAEIAARIAQSPDRPWLHVAEWDQGRIRNAPAKQTAVGLGVFAFVWLAVVIGAALLARGRDDLRSHPAVLVFLGLFGLIGLGLVAGTIYFAIAGRKFGPATLEMGSVPGVLGGWLRGNIAMPEEVPGGCEARVRLLCWRNSTGSSRFSDDAWSEDAAAMTGASVPVAFRIPFNLPESDLPGMPARGGMRVTWLLSIATSLPGVDYSAVFEVPVFATETSDKAFVTGGTSPGSPP